MQSLAYVLLLVLILSAIIAIVLGIFWFKERKNKEGKKYKRNRLGTLIALAVMVISLFSAGGAQSEATHEEEAAIARQEKLDKQNYKDNKEDFTSLYYDLGVAVEQLSSKESDEWESAIDNSGEDFDVDSTIDNISDNHSDDIDDVEAKIEKLHSLDQKIQKNEYASDEDKETIHNAYLDLKHFANHATSISGSYNDFSDEHNELDRKTTDRVEELQDL